MAAHDSSFWRQISSPISNRMTFKFKVRYKWCIGKNVVFIIKTACIYLGNSEWYGESYYRPIATHIRAFDWPRSITLNDICRSFQPMLSFPRPISRKLCAIRFQKLTLLKRNQGSFYVIRLSMSLAVFHGHWTVSHQISRKRCVIRQKLL